MDTLARIRLLTGDDPFWNTQNPLLLKGEVGFRNVEGDDPLMRVGDGVRRWMDLPDMNKLGLTGPTGETGPVGPIGPTGPQGPQGTPGDAQAPWRVPFGVATAADFTIMQIGFSVGPAPNYAIQPAVNEDGFFGPYAFWFSPSEQWGLPAGGEVLEMHHYWPGRQFSAMHPNVVGTYFSVDGPNGPMIEITPGGSGRLGAHDPNAAMMYWGSGAEAMGSIGWGGGFTIIGPPGYMFGLSAGTLNTFGGAPVSFNSINGVTMGYTCYMGNSTPTQPGQNACNVLRVQGGWDRSDVTLRVVDSTNTIRLDVRGDGAIFVNPTRATSWPFNVGYLVDGQLVVQSSSRRYKTNIRSTTRERAREIVSKLRVVSFNSLLPDEDPDHLNFGLIAEEVAAAEPTLASFDKEGKAESVRYQEIALLLLPLVQELLGMTEPTGEIYG